MQIRNIHSTNSETGEVTWTGVQLISLQPGRRHHFSPEWVEKHVDRGLATLSKKDITLHTVDGDMVFHIDHGPGRVCLHCGEKLLSEEDKSSYPAGHPKLGEAARAHVAKQHEGVASPNPSFPAGYKFKHYYGTTPDESVPTVNPKATQVTLEVV